MTLFLYIPVFHPISLYIVKIISVTRNLIFTYYLYIKIITKVCYLDSEYWKTRTKYLTIICVKRKKLHIFSKCFDRSHFEFTYLKGVLNIQIKKIPMDLWPKWLHPKYKFTISKLHLRCVKFLSLVG